MMTLTRDLVAPDLTTIEHLDWEHQPTCERGAASPDGPCGAKAWALIWFSCPAGVCGSEQLFICHGCWVLGHQPGVVAICSTCWAHGLAMQHCGIVAVL